MRTRGVLPLLGALVMAACGGSGGDGAGTGGAGRDPNAVTVEEPFAPPVLLGQLDDETIQESSGLAASRRNPEFLWTHNDSGDGPAVYCLTRAAVRCGTWALTGAEALDWEDMAAGPGPVASQPYLYMGDIGDNNKNRADVIVYRVAEPMAPSADATTLQATEPAEVIRLQYDDGAHDAEALMVHPTKGDIYVVTKDAADTGVYKAAAGTTTLVRIDTLRLGFDEVVTGGDIAADGQRAVLSTYRQAYEYGLPGDAAGFDDIWAQRRRPVTLAPRAQGEAIAYRLDGNALLTTSEKLPMPLHETVRR